MNWQKVLRNLWFFLWNRALAIVSCAFCQPHAKNAPCPPVCFYDSMWSTTWYDVVDIWNRVLATVSWAFCRPHVPKVVWGLQYDFLLHSSAHFVGLMFQKWSDVFNFYTKSSSRHCFVHVLSTPSSKSAPKVTTFNHVYVNSSSPYSLVHISSTTSPDRGANRGNRNVLSATTDGHCGRKILKFREGECFQNWSHALPMAHASLLFDDDVVDMMGWLTWWLRWWWGCHDDVVDMLIEMMMLLPWCETGSHDNRP